jgi:HK97 gp10 family phage protein
VGAAKLAYKITGAKKIIDKVNGIKAEILSTQVDAVREATLLVHETAVKSLQDNADGTPQIRYQPKRVVNVSKPGTAPNTDTGRAVQSIKMDFQDSGLIGRIGTNLRYLAQLEFGTKNTEARPWLSSALTATQTEIKKIFQAAFKKGAKPK